MTGHEGGRHGVDASATGLAQITRPRGLGVVAAWCRDLSPLTGGTTDAVRPAPGTDGRHACGVVDAGWHGYPGARLAPGTQQHTGQRQVALC
jgi:hypothetical protein